MAIDEVLAERVRGLVARREDVQERRMFGGLAFLVRGHMACGVHGAELILRLGNDAADAALRRRHVRPMDFTGRPIASMVIVAKAGWRRDRDLRAWIAKALRFAEDLPPK
jgi:TfoX/Sxy family transcriptional regulator of competence genes